MTIMTNKYNKHILAAAMLMVGGAATAQNLNSAYFTDQYAFRHTMNPAYGNEQNYVSIPAMGNINVSMHGNFGYEDVIMKNPRFGIDSDKKMTTFMNPYISDSKALDGFSTGNNRLTGDVNIAILSAGFKALAVITLWSLTQSLLWEWYCRMNSSNLHVTQATRPMI